MTVKKKVKKIAAKKRTPKKKKEDGYKFNPDLDFWEASHWMNFWKIQDMFQGKDNLEFLEIGTYEGKTTVWLINNVLTGAGCKISTIDAEEHPNTPHNLKKHSDMVYFYMGQSHLVLPTLYHRQGSSYDFIYVDGDHHASSMLEDIVMSWRLLKVGGILLMDDYEMEAKDPWFYIMHKEFLEHPRVNFVHPRCAIDAFLSLYRGQYELVFDNYQKGVRKLIDMGGKNLIHGDNGQPKSFKYKGKK